jgi:hypothetical protein
MGLLKISAFGVGSVVSAWIAWRLLSMIFVISVLVLKIAIFAILIVGGVWLFRRIMREPVRSDTAV